MSAVWTAADGNPVEFTGAVYNQRHGIQPKRLGSILAKNSKPEFASSLGKVTFLNYTYLAEELTVRYAIKDKNGNKLAIIEDKPSYSKGTLTRELSVTPKAIASKVTFSKQGNFSWKVNGKNITSMTLSAPATLTTTLK